MDRSKGMGSLTFLTMNEDPEFQLRLVGYSRREVDEFVAEVRRELRELAPSQDVRVIGGPAADPDAPQAVRVVALAQDEADRRIAEATGQAEQTLRGARELADQILGEARRRAAELETRVAQALEREIATRVGELTRTHARMVAGLTGMRDTISDLLATDDELGPLEPNVYLDLVPQQRELISQPPPLAWPERR